jgi:hypothetical protein
MSTFHPQEQLDRWRNEERGILTAHAKKAGDAGRSCTSFKNGKPGDYSRILLRIEAEILRARDTILVGVPFDVPMPKSKDQQTDDQLHAIIATMSPEARRTLLRLCQTLVRKDAR